MANLSIGELQCRTLAKSYGLYLKDQWLQFQIKTLAQRGIIPFQDYRQFMDLCKHLRGQSKDGRVLSTQHGPHKPECVGPQCQARGSAINGHGVMDEP